MSKFAPALVGVGLLAALCSAPLHAQGPLPRTSIVQRGADRLLEDVQYMMSLTPEGREQWPTVKSFAEDIFLLGVNRAQPLRIDVILGDGPTRYRPAFPVAKERDFLDNLEGFGIDTRKKGTGFWQLRGGFDGYLRIKDGYGSIAEEKHEADIPESLAAPTSAIKPLIDADYDLALELSNTAVDPASMKTRAEKFREHVRTAILEKVGRLEDESKEDYDLRVLTIEQQLSDYEWFFAETAHVVAGWSADVRTGVGTSTFVVDPIPGSELEAAIKLLGEEPSYFANIPEAEGAILSLRLNHPLDPHRKANFEAFYASLATALRAQVDAGAKSDDEKEAAKQVSDLVIGMLADGARAGVADGFAEVAPIGGDGAHVGVAGIKSPDGKTADAIVKLLPKANEKFQVKLDTMLVADVAIHEVIVPLGELPHFEFIFGKNPVLYIGTSQDAVWFAAGPNALPSLQSAINLVGKEQPALEPGAPFAKLRMQLRPWLEFRERRAGESGDPELRKIVMTALATGDDTLSLECSREGNQLKGNMVIRDGVMRMIGRMMAKFSKENLEG